MYEHTASHARLVLMCVVVVVNALLVCVPVQHHGALDVVDSRTSPAAAVLRQSHPAHHVRTLWCWYVAQCLTAVRE